MADRKIRIDQITDTATEPLNRAAWLVMQDGSKTKKASVGAAIASVTKDDVGLGNVANKSEQQMADSGPIRDEILAQPSVKYVIQSLSDPQKAQARDNTGTDPSVYPSYSNAASSYKSAATAKISANVGGALTEWLPLGGAPCLGGGWTPANGKTPEHFNGVLADAHSYLPTYAVDYGSKDWGVILQSNLYSAEKYSTASWQRLQHGRLTAPIDDARPIIGVTKFTNATRDVDPQAWDQGVYHGLVKVSGDAFAACTTSWARANGGSGDVIGMHGRAQAMAGFTGRVYGVWAYADVRTPLSAAHGIEIDGRSEQDPGWNQHYSLAILGTVDYNNDNNRFSNGIKLVQQNSALNGGFWTGINIPKNTIIETTGALDDGEHVMLGGGEGVGSVGGIRFREGTFKYAIRTTETSFVGNTAFFLGSGQRIRWNDLSTGPNIVGGTTSLTLANASVNISDPVSGAALLVAGVRVLTTRRTGWTIATGTANRATFATTTVTTEQLAERVKALIDDLVTHGLIGA